MPGHVSTKLWQARSQESTVQSRDFAISHVDEEGVLDAGGLSFNCQMGGQSKVSKNLAGLRGRPLAGEGPAAQMSSCGAAPSSSTVLVVDEVYTSMLNVCVCGFVSSSPNLEYFPDTTPPKMPKSMAHGGLPLPRASAQLASGSATLSPRPPGPS